MNIEMLYASLSIDEKMKLLKLMQKQFTQHLRGATPVEEWIRQNNPSVRLTNVLMRLQKNQEGKLLNIEVITEHDLMNTRNCGLNTLFEFKLLREKEMKEE